MKTEKIKLSQIAVNEDNPRTISKENFDKLINSILVLPKMLELRPIVIDDTMKALGGNMRYRALSAIAGLSAADINQRLENLHNFQNKTDGEQQVLKDYWAKWLNNPTTPVIKASELTEKEQREFIIKDNVGFGEWDTEALANDWDAEELDEWGLDVLHKGWGEGGSDGSSDAGGVDGKNDRNGSLIDRFIIPPFSILDSRKGLWQRRKKLWRAKVPAVSIGDSRKNTLTTSPEINFKDLYAKTQDERAKLGISFREYLEKYVPKDVLERESKKVIAQGTSLFDPVLAEVIMRWFCPPKGRILDPFGGEQTKGIVAGVLGFDYEACEIRKEQVDADNEATKDYPSVKYFCGDSNDISKIIPERGFDMCFTSPPYYDLEVYSKDDLSSLGTYEEFMEQYENIFRQCVDMMADEGFLVVKVGEIRDKKTGALRNFVGDNTAMFKRLGLSFYNEIIFVEMSATAAFRASRYMDSRKVAKTHQNILVFYKGDLKNIKNRYPRIEYTDDDINRFKEEFSEEDTDDETGDA